MILPDPKVGSVYFLREVFTEQGKPQEKPHPVIVSSPAKNGDVILIPMTTKVNRVPIKYANPVNIDLYPSAYEGELLDPESQSVATVWDYVQKCPAPLTGKIWTTRMKDGEHIFEMADGTTKPIIPMNPVPRFSEPDWQKYCENAPESMHQYLHHYNSI